MEDTLGAKYVLARIIVKAVLILVLVEDTIGDDTEQNLSEAQLMS